MKKKLIIALLMIVTSTTHAVEKSAGVVDNLPISKWPTDKTICPIQKVFACKTYDQDAIEAPEEFVFVVHATAGQIAMLKGENVFGNWNGSLESELAGVSGSQSIYSFHGGVELKISEMKIAGRGGGRGGNFSPIVLKSATLTLNGEQYDYFCN